jgi:formylglycine-generating enzyme required for sulfatase activity
MTTSPPRVNFLLRQPRQVQGFRELLHPNELAESSEQGAEGLLDGGPAPAPGQESPALTMLWIPPGRFLMGSPPAEPERDGNEGPQHLVQLQEFFISQTPITQAQWREVAGWQKRPGEEWGRLLNMDPSAFQSKEGQRENVVRLLDGESNTDQRPVEMVSWDDAMEFCHRLSQRTSRTYTLPSEAQWEYACRAGTGSPFHFGEMITTELANYRGSGFTYGDVPKGIYQEQTTPVRMFPTNSWGLHDMHGNVWEWCLDHFHASYEGAPADGSAWLYPEAQTDWPRLLRGGTWLSNPGECRSAFRYTYKPGVVSSNLGFRVVCLPQGPSLNP